MVMTHWPPPRSEVVSAADGALVDKCSWCEREGLCVCPHCDAHLCAHHFHDTDCPVCVRAAKRRRVSGKQPDTPKKDGPDASTPVKVKVETATVPKEEPNDEDMGKIVHSGGWPKCSHPSCRFGDKTLNSLTGQVRGVAHHSSDARGVCRRCVCVPWPQQDAQTDEESKRDRKQKLQAASDIQLDWAKWDNDTLQSIVEEYTWTVLNPGRYQQPRKTMVMRLASV